MKTSIALVDDHQLFLRSLSLLIQTFSRYEVVTEALNGKDLAEKLEAKALAPDLVLIDVNIPVMNGIETAQWLQEHRPGSKLVALSMNDSDKSIIGMLKAGCCAYLLKDTHPDEFERGLHEICTKGYYNADASNINYRRLIVAEREQELQLTDKERRFLQLACSDLTYKQIAAEMHLSERTIDGYREALFGKLNVQSRVGLCLEAIRREVVRL